MRFVLILIGSLAMGLPSQADDLVKRGNCRGLDIDTSDSSVVIETAVEGDVTLFPGGQTVQLSLKTCDDRDGSDCDAFYWDHDGNGTKTQNTLDGDGDTFTRGVRVPAVPSIQFSVDASPSLDDTAVVLFCPKNT